MAKGADRFEAAARSADVDVRIRRFPKGTRTAEDAARAVGCEIGQIVKSLVFVADGIPFLALTSGKNRADPTRLAGVMGAREVRTAAPDEARAATGFAIGGTPPFGHPTRLKVLVDRDLLVYQELWAAAGAPDAVFPIRPDVLLSSSGGEVADFKVPLTSGKEGPNSRV
jgi:prolyl-tRNA editing enzyme YbaK/EbsC (Cys-tRNA(Pro) deacylase)